MIPNLATTNGRRGVAGLPRCRVLIGLLAGAALFSLALASRALAAGPNGDTLDVTVTDVPQFEVTERQIDGPLLKVGRGVMNAGEIDVPFDVGRRDLAIDATETFMRPQSLRLADLTVFYLEGRTVKLRFTMIGTPPPPFPAAYPRGQALVTVRVDLVVLPNR